MELSLSVVLRDIGEIFDISVSVPYESYNLPMINVFSSITNCSEKYKFLAWKVFQMHPKCFDINYHTNQLKLSLALGLDKTS